MAMAACRAVLHALRAGPEINANIRVAHPCGSAGATYRMWFRLTVSELPPCNTKLSRDTHFHAVTHGTHIFGFALARRSSLLRHLAARVKCGMRKFPKVKCGIQVRNHSCGTTGRFRVMGKKAERRSAGTLIHCLLLRKQTFSSSAGSRFAVKGLL